MSQTGNINSSGKKEIEVSCTVHVYDSKNNSVSSSDIEIIAENLNNRKILAIGRNKHLEIGYSEEILELYQTRNKYRAIYGAKLRFPQGNFGYKIIIDDNREPSSYAPSVLYPFNGSVDGKLDVILYPLPSSPPLDSESPSSFSEVESYINDARWTETEKVGVTMLIAALALIRAGSDKKLQSLQNRWTQEVEAIGIPSAIILREPPQFGVQFYR